MASATELELRERIQELAQLLIAEKAGSQECEEVPLFTRLENEAIAIGDAITKELVEQQLALLREQSHQCPKCRGDGLHKGDRERVIQTRRGEVKFTEPEFYCPRCRRAFFPSVGNAGPGRGL